MIVRILGEGQLHVDDSAAAELNELDARLEAAVERRDQAGFAAASAALFSRIKEIGTPAKPGTGYRPPGVPTTLIDWPPSETGGFDYTDNVKDTVVNAFAYAAYRAMAQIATQTGHASEAGTYSGDAARLQSAIEHYMFDPAADAFYDGLDSSDQPIQHESMDTSVYVLAMGAASSSEAQKAAELRAREVGAVRARRQAQLEKQGGDVGDRPN